MISTRHASIRPLLTIPARTVLARTIPARTVLALALLALPAAATAQRCVGLPADMYVAGGFGFLGRDGGSGRGVSLDVRVRNAVVSGEYGTLGAVGNRETAFAGQVALLPTGGDDPDAWTSALCPLVHFDHLSMEVPQPAYLAGGPVRTSFGVGVAAGIELHTAYLQHILYFAPRVDWYTRELRFDDGTVEGPYTGVLPGYTVGLTVRAPGLFYVRFTQTTRRPRDFYRSYFSVQIGTWF